MNSWIGGGLSSLKGQLSHLITEGTEEISDTNGEINRANSKIVELEDQVMSDAKEIEELKDRNNNLKMKLESEELLLQNVSESYQDKLREKEEIIEALTNKLSNVSRMSANGTDDIGDNSRLSASDDGFSNDYCDQFHRGQKQWAAEINGLQTTIRELHQEITKWKLMSQRNEEGCADQSSISLEGTINRLLEEQERELELRHSNYVMELQQEHSKQICFLNSKLHAFQQSIGPNDDDEDEEEEEKNNATISDMTGRDEDLAANTSFGNVSTQTDNEGYKSPHDDFHGAKGRYWQVLTKSQINELLDAAADKIIDKESSLEMIVHRIATSGDCTWDSVSPIGCQGNTTGDDVVCTSDSQLTIKIAAQVKLAIADSVSQVSDISEVSIKSRMLEEHVRHLTQQIGEYERQLSDMELAPLAPDSSGHLANIQCKLENLKVKLCQRKHVNDQPDLPEGTDEEPSGNVADSWENSSANSVVGEEGAYLGHSMLQQPPQDLTTTGDVCGHGDLVDHIRDMFAAVCGEDRADVIGQHGAGGVEEMVRAVVAIGRVHLELRGQLLAFYEEVNGRDVMGMGLDVQQAVALLCDGYRVMRDTCSVHDYVLQENRSLKERMDQLAMEAAVAANDVATKCDLEAKNSEREGQMTDWADTIRESGCDRCVKLDMQLALLSHVETFNQSTDECIQALEAQIVRLQNLCEEKDDRLGELDRRQIDIVMEYDGVVEALHAEVAAGRVLVQKLQQDELCYKGQLCQLQDNLQDREDMIGALNEELTMLSVVGMDDGVGVSVVGVERCVQTDEDYNEGHMLLQQENTRLQQVVEAQAASMGQYEIKMQTLQGDVSRLSRMTGEDDVRQESMSAEDMAKETLQHLSQMVRDRQWEIDALRARNDSLHAIIKGGCGGDDEIGVVQPNIDYIDVVLGEKETLLKELHWYQQNRDQLIAALNVKHKESLDYHGELQRLICYINGQEERWAELGADNGRLRERLQSLEEGPRGGLVDVGVAFTVGDGDDEGQELHFGQLQCPVDAGTPSPALDVAPVTEHCCTALQDHIHQQAAEILALQQQLQHTSFQLQQAHLHIVDGTNDLDGSEHLSDQFRAVGGPPLPQELGQQVDNKTSGRRAMWDEHGIDNEDRDDDSTQEHWQHMVLARQVECDNYVHQIEQLKAREVKLLKEKQIFQDHLIRVEESYTQEATLSEDREQSLRTKLREAEDGVQAGAVEVGELRAALAGIRCELQGELAATRVERDDALQRLRLTEGQLAEHSRSLTNLQAVLDTFQQDQAAEAADQRDKLQMDLHRLTMDRDRWERRCVQLQADIDDQCTLVDAARRLTEQMEHRDDQLAQMQASLAGKDERIDGLKMEIRKLHSFTESKVDKVLMRNMVIGYFHTPQHRRQEALKVIGSLLQFADADYNQIGIDTANKSRWFSWLRPTAAGDRSTGQDQDMSGKSFSELFISFLERESSPMPQVRLPTNKIAEDARQHSSLSQSQEYPYMSQPAPGSSITDHHKFFASSPVITKRNGSPSIDLPTDSSDGPRDAPLLYIPTMREASADTASAQSEFRTTSNHRRSDSGRNALLSLLDQ